ncbi:hypothetical protein [Ferrimonas marina]|uniref:hypothetical protein n=1 Tax=Ferrimonas marina TaxID=299255 RepID=UPI0011612D76|nr:hypothetical protein [Ferrimonas marina]
MNKEFRSELDIKSLMKVLGVCGFGTGVILMIISLFAGMFFQPYESGADVFLGSVILPLTGGFYGLLNALFGYPFYKWWCNRNRGQKISGIFVEEQSS